MIIIDSSCWVEFYAPGGSEAVGDAVAKAIESGEAATCGIIAVEILGFISRKAEFAMVSEDFTALLDAGVLAEDFKRATTIGRALRGRGVTVPATDLIIAAVAAGRGALLLHRDHHFETIARHSALRQRFVG